MSPFDRRDFIKLALAAASTSALGCESPGTSSSRRTNSGAANPNAGANAPSGSGQEPSASSDDTEKADAEKAEEADETRVPDVDLRRRPIPGTDETLPVVGLGTWRQFDVPQNSAKLDQLRTVLAKMAAMGGEVIDSSPMYGRAESTVGHLLGKMNNPDAFFLATKVWTSGQQDGIRQMNASFRKMNAEVIDLMQVHNLVDWQTHLETLKKWKADGRIRYIGITHYTTGALSRLADVIRREPAIDFVQFAYSIDTRAPEDELLQVAAEHDVATLINRPYEGGGLFRRVKGHDLPDWAGELGIDTWAQYFLKFLLADERVTCVIPGTSDPKHLVDNLGAAIGPLPDAAQRKKMAEYWRTL